MRLSRRMNGQKPQLNHRFRIRAARLSLVLLLSVLIPAVFAAAVQQTEKKRKITFLVGESDSFNFSTAIADVMQNEQIAENFSIQFFTHRDLQEGVRRTSVHAQILDAEVLVVDIMYRGHRLYTAQNVDFAKTRVYSTRFKPMDELGKKFIFDPKVLQYNNPATIRNIQNMILYLLNRDAGMDLAYQDPAAVPESGIFHPDTSQIFARYEDYVHWYRQSRHFKPAGFWLGITDYSRYAAPGQTGEITCALIRAFEKAGINVITVFSYPSYRAVEDFLLNPDGSRRVDMLCALSFKLGAVSDEKAQAALEKLNVPLINAIRVSRPIAEWRASPQGLNTFEVSTRICKPEFNALIEPTVVGGFVPADQTFVGRPVYTFEPIPENIAHLTQRVKAWRNLQTKANRLKKVAIFYYNHSPGKQNVGASYLNVFRSTEQILARMRREGFFVEGSLPAEADIKEMILRSGRNIGSWAPGELQELTAGGGIVKVPVARYRQWYENLPAEFRRQTEKQWGQPEASDIMIQEGQIIIPCVQLGNVILLPQPSRGWGDDPMKMYHSPLVWPPHQYTAVYLWLKHEFQADAVVHLGRHGTHEWLPGKQAGLSPECPPEVLLQDLPNIYPYVVDGIGEGLQAKRRGRAVIIDHLTPVFKTSGLHQEYRRLSNLIGEYNVALTKAPNLAEQKLQRVRELVEKTGIAQDLDRDIDPFDEAAVEEIEHYLAEIEQNIIPYGLHTFGISPDGGPRAEMAAAVHQANPALTPAAAAEKIRRSGPDELERFIKALNGRYVPPGEGNDPVRNPEAAPTGKNFYGFDPKKVPSREAYALGEENARLMIHKHLGENGAYPRKIAIVLWCGETVRNEGINESTALYLMGMRPVWAKNDRVVGVEPIPGDILARPRIDVHIQASGLYRDSFPSVMELLDDAVQQAAALGDVENFIAVHSENIRQRLEEKGYSAKDAERLSKARIFSAKPGSYGTKIAELIPNSSVWESQEEIADVFINQVSYAYGKGLWGKQLKSAYKGSLENVDMTLHSRSGNLYRTLDNDDFYQYLGGLSMAVKNVKGDYPDVVVSRQENPDRVYIEDIEKTLGREMRSRYLNPTWIEGMKKENYAGAREMADFVENLWGWQTTTPHVVDAAKWEEVHEVYVLDKYGLDLKEFFDQANPWAYQSMNARMLEAVRKDYWRPTEEVQKSLAREYTLNVIEKGVACCEHTCNNPMLQQFVANLVSLYGLLTPQQLDQFKLQLAKATGRSQAENEARKRQIRESITRSLEQVRREETVETQNQGKPIEGFEMVEDKAEKTETTASGAEWMVMVVAFFVLGLLFFGWQRVKI